MEAVGFCTEHSANARSIGYEEERLPTFRASVVPAAVALENHPADSRGKISEDGKVQTLTRRCDEGGGNVPLVMDNPPAVTLKNRSGFEGGGKGAIWQEDKSTTLGCNNDQTVFVPKAYGVCAPGTRLCHDNRLLYAGGERGRTDPEGTGLQGPDYGVALSCVYFVLTGIALYAGLEE